jgi:hypothetical protein
MVLEIASKFTDTQFCVKTLSASVPEFLLYFLYHLIIAVFDPTTSVNCTGVDLGSEIPPQKDKNRED